MLWVKENMTLIELAQETSLVPRKKITVDSLFRKIQNETIEYNET